jgi:hypothetical protein
MEQNKTLKSSEVCSIVKACHDAGVRVLKFSGLELEFFTNAKPTTLEANEYFPDKAQSEVKRAETLLEAKENLEQEAAAIKQMQLDQMLIEDPAQYEHLLLAGELEDAEAGDQGTERAL